MDQRDDAAPAAFEGCTLTRVFDGSLTKYRDRTAVVDEERSFTYGELDRRSAALANGLVDEGVRPGDRVGCLMANRVAFATTRLAVIRAGAAFSPLNPSLSFDELGTLVSTARVGTLVCGPDHLATAADLRRRLDPVDRIVYLGGETADEDVDVVDYETLIASHVGTATPDVRADPEDVASVTFTGGTTGDPKGVVHTHRSRVQNLLAHQYELDITGESRLLLTTPLAHGARLSLKAGLLAGATVHVRRSFDASTFAADVREHDVTWTWFVPTMLYRLLEAGVQADDVPTLETIAYGGAPVSAVRLAEAVDRLGPRLVQFYGQAEVPVLATTLGKKEHAAGVRSDDSDALASAGSPCLLADVRIVDDDGTTVPQGDVGEIAARSAYTMSGYFENPEATDATLRDGWVHTGDVGRIDDRGRLHVVDRESNVVISGGMNVYTSDVEAAVERHPDVQRCAVFGVDDPDWGEAVTAAVVRTDDDFGDDDLRTFVADRLAPYERPKAVHFVDELPLTAYGKVDRQALAERFG